MSTSTPDFLHVLGLDTGASERDVRRAYARQLKAIDHEVDVDAFHALRDHYQSALQWVAERGGADAEPDVPQAAPASVEAGVHDERKEERKEERDQERDEEDTEASVEPVQKVLEELVTKLRHWIDSEEKAAAALDTALGDPRLSSIDAPARFEAGVAVLLAKGWQPGHQFLFLPAIRRFGWMEDFRRLETLGALGAFLKAAILQRQAFFDQPPEVFEALAALIRRLRDAKEPSERMLLQQMLALRGLLAQYPEWLHVVTSSTNVRRWLERFAALPESTTKAALENGLLSGEARRPWWKRISPSVFIWLFLLLMGLGKAIVDLRR